MMRRGSDGFTLIEIVIVIVVLGIIASIAIASIGDFISESRVSATRSEMLEIKKAIVGDPQVVSAGKHTSRGFLGDCGFIPERLQDLIARPDSVPTFNKIEGFGWNGPYVDSSGGEYLTDAWGAPYAYDPSGRSMVSNGGSETITITF